MEEKIESIEDFIEKEYNGEFNDYLIMEEEFPDFNIEEDFMPFKEEILEEAPIPFLEEDMEFSKKIANNVEGKYKTYFYNKYINKEKVIPYGNLIYGDFFIDNLTNEKDIEFLYKEMNKNLNHSLEEQYIFHGSYFNNIELLTRKEKAEKIKLFKKLEKKYYNKIKKSKHHKIFKEKAKKTPHYLMSSFIKKYGKEIKKDLKLDKEYCISKALNVIEREFNFEIKVLNSIFNEIFELEIKSEKITKKVKVEIINSSGAFGEAGGYYSHEENYIRVNKKTFESEKEISFDDLLTFVHELGHACESILCELEIFKQAKNNSSESISLLFETLMIKNLDFFEIFNKEYLDYVMYIEDYMRWVDAYFCKLYIKEREQKKIHKSKKTYKCYLEHTIKNRMIFCLDYSYTPFDEYLRGYLIADTLMELNK